MERFVFWFGKLFYAFYTIVLPIMLGVPWWRCVLLVFVSWYVQGMWLALFFQVRSMTSIRPLTRRYQVNHVTDMAQFVVPDQLKCDWAVQQIVGTTNFATGSWFWNNLSGGLNHQIEHHLFPYVCHMYYPQIAPIVQQVCRERKIPYQNYTTFWAALDGHFSHLKNMGKEPKLNQ